MTNEEGDSLKCMDCKGFMQLYEEACNALIESEQEKKEKVQSDLYDFFFCWAFTSMSKQFVVGVNADQFTLHLPFILLYDF